MTEKRRSKRPRTPNRQLADFDVGILPSMQSSHDVTWKEKRDEDGGMLLKDIYLVFSLECFLKILYMCSISDI